MGGIAGVAIGIALAYPLSATYLFWQTKLHLHISLRDYFLALRLPLQACGWMAAWVLGIAWLLQSAGLQNEAAILLIKICVGAVSYAGFLIYIRQDGLRDCREVLSELSVPEKWLHRWPFSRIQ
jgi:hypothetical protein